MILNMSSGVDMRITVKKEEVVYTWGKTDRQRIGNRSGCNKVSILCSMVVAALVTADGGGRESDKA